MKVLCIYIRMYIHIHPSLEIVRLKGFSFSSTNMTQSQTKSLHPEDRRLKDECVFAPLTMNMYISRIPYTNVVVSQGTLFSIRKQLTNTLMTKWSTSGASLRCK